ncbi:MAG: cytochrome c3 family protein [Nitrospirota bacterium]
MLCALQSEAKITGACSNCHTMHNSQNGQHMIILGPGETDTSPKNNLLRASCLGCHSKTDGSSWKDPVTGAPVVFNTLQPSYNSATGLAGGNFYWVQSDDAKGHNITQADGNLTVAPGASNGLGCGTTSCHQNLYTANTAFGARQGCSNCHMMGNSSGPTGYHHNNTNGTLADSAEEGWYRFLAGHMSGDGQGVTGIEDSDWQQNPGASVHNEYLGYSATKTSAGGFSACGNTVTGYCTGCHGNFHIQDDTTAGSPWIRHPSDFIVPGSGEYSSAFNASGGTGTYDPLVPVARPSLSGWTGPSSTVTLGTDLVMCLSCHRAHASPYFKMVRWDYRGWPGNAGTNGCTVCHTSKN